MGQWEYETVKNHWMVKPQKYPCYQNACDHLYHPCLGCPGVRTELAPQLTAMTRPAAERMEH